VIARHSQLASWGASLKLLYVAETILAAPCLEPDTHNFMKGWQPEHYRRSGVYDLRSASCNILLVPPVCNFPDVNKRHLPAFCCCCLLFGGNNVTRPQHTADIICVVHIILQPVRSPTRSTRSSTAASGPVHMPYTDGLLLAKLKQFRL